MDVNQDALFSQDPSVRWEEACKWAQGKGWTKSRNAQLRLGILDGALAGIGEEDIDSLTDLPRELRVHVGDWGEKFALCGSLNAWMAFVGPSPGSSPSQSGRMNELLDASEHIRNPVLGRPHPSLWYVDGAGFFDEVRLWVEGAYDAAGYFRKSKDEFGALASFLMLNLVKKAYGPEWRVPTGHLGDGATRFWRDVIPVARPRLVVALTRGSRTRTGPRTRGVYRTLLQAASDLGLQVSESPATRFESGARSYSLPRALIRATDWGHVLLVTVPTHPSRLHGWINEGKIRSRADVIAYLGGCVEEALSPRHD